MKLIILKGLPASGKTTFALNKVKDGGGNWIRVNKDEIRAMSHADVYTKGNEKMTRDIESCIILEALDAEKNVIVDSTNLDPSNEERIRSVVQKLTKMKWKDVEIEVKTFDTPLLECIERDKKREKPVGEKVIRDMFNKYLKQEVAPVEFVLPLPYCIISDLDGTIALHNGRDPYDAAKCETDLLNKPLEFILQRLRWGGLTTFFVSGREDQFRPQTEAWLAKHGLTHQGLFMRQTGDKRNDAIVKQEIYEKEIKGKFNVVAIFDDRARVCRMWHSLGLPLHRIGDPDAEF